MSAPALLRADSGAHAAEAPEPPPHAVSGRGRGLGLLAVAVLLSALAVRALYEPFGIPSGSMAPTLKAGDHVLADRLAYRLSAPRRGDLAVFERPGSGEVTLKRVVAVEGSRVAIEDGALYLDGQRQSELYVDERRIDGVYFGPAVVPPGSVFVLGDNRADSSDSRSFGPLSRERLIGRVVLRFWPPDRAGVP